MSKIFTAYRKYGRVFGLVLIAILFFLGSLTFFQAMCLLFLSQIGAQLERLVLHQELKRQYQEYLIRASQRKT